MEKDEDYFVEISLDSVLRKATELEVSLRVCKARAETNPPAEPAEEGRISQPIVAATTTTTTTTTTRVPASVDLTDQWQKLTAYIVSLEKEVQYYKQLLQDVQASQNTEVTEVTDTTDCPVGGQHLVSSQTKGQEGEMNAEYWKTLMDKDSWTRALLSVFSYLSRQELCRASLVCRKWYRMSRHPQLWKEVIMSETMVEPEVLFRIAQWCSYTERLILHGLMPPIASCNEDLQSYIQKTRGSLEPGLKAVMVASSTTLSSLTITECNLMATERVLWLTSVHCPNLHSLTYCSDEFPPSSESLWSLANGCRHLQHLTLPPVLDSENANWFNDSCLLIIAHSWPNLLSLTIGGSSITPDGLRQIAQRCSKLYFLEVMYGPSLHNEAMEKLCTEGGFRSLRRLVLNFTPASHVALQLLIENVSSLEILEMHVTLRSYFTDIDQDTITKYSKILSNIKKLKKHPRGKEIFYLYEH